jgi:hypothetical protein
MRIFGYNISVTRGHPYVTSNTEPKKPKVTGIDPGRVSAPEDGINGLTYALKDFNTMVDPSFRVEVIQLLRNLYKVNPDVSKALQDMYQLANTGHRIGFPNNTSKEAEAMVDHLKKASKKWSNYTAGTDGLVNKMMVQLLIGGAISIEGVPNQHLDGLSTVLFIKPDSIMFKRESDGVYTPYQKSYANLAIGKDTYIKLNTLTYKYVGMYNDTDEPYGIPPFMAALDSLKGQSDMRINFKHIMENAGLLGFMEVLMDKPDQRPSESTNQYEHRLEINLLKLKRRMKEGMKDGLVVGYKEDHEFKLNSTTQDMGNLDIPWKMNQQSVANGLGVNSTLLGVTDTNTEGGAGINLSKLISQLKVIQNLVGSVLEFLYSLELQLAGFNNKGIKITWNPATVTDDVKIQQATQYKVQNLNALYRDGIISMLQYAQEMGYDSPDQEAPRVPIEQQNNGKIGIEDKERKDDKSKSDRGVRDKNNPMPKRKDQNSKPR